MAPPAPAEAPRAPFAGFGPAALPFFEGLAANQTREWFLEHRQTWESDIRDPLGALVADLAFAFQAHDIPLAGDAERSVFRIHRDVRFSKDKRPYKTNAGATLTRDGVKMSQGLLYIQVGGADGSFMAAGFYGPEPRELAALRQAIAAAPERWRSLEADLAEAGLNFGSEASLTRAPKGFESVADPLIQAALRRRNLIVSQPIAAERLAEPELLDDIVAFAETALPLLRFGWSALDRAREPSFAAAR